MKIEACKDGGFTLKEVYNGVMFVTEEGQQLSVAMRDGGFEIGLFKPQKSDFTGNVLLLGPAWISVQDGEVVKE